MEGGKGDIFCVFMELCGSQFHLDRKARPVGAQYEVSLVMCRGPRAMKDGKATVGLLINVFIIERDITP